MLSRTKTSWIESEVRERKTSRVWSIALVAMAICGVAYYNSTNKRIPIDSIEPQVSKHVYAEKGLQRVNVLEHAKVVPDTSCGRNSDVHVCIPSGGSGRFDVEFGSWVVPSTGVISGMELTWVSGELLECGAASLPNCRGRWGITLSNYGYSVYLTRSDGSVIYPTALVPNAVVTLSGHYQLSPTPLTQADVNSATFRMTFGRNISVTAGDTLRFYDSEVVVQQIFDNNVGQTCVTVTPFYEPSSASSLNAVCIPGGRTGNVEREFSAWVVPSTGVISAVELTWMAGEMKMCGAASARNCRGRWGITLGGWGYAVYLTRSDKSVIFPTSAAPNVLLRETGTYAFSIAALTVAEVDSPTFRMEFGRNIFVRQGEVLRFYNSEVIVQQHHLNNVGTTCASVNPVYVQPQPSLQASVCIPAGWIDAFGSLFAPRSGVISSVTLTRTSGQMRYCGSSSCVGTFGSVTTDYQIYVTRADRRQVIFPIGGTRGYERATSVLTYNGYKLVGQADARSGDSLTLELGERSVTQGEELKFWAAESLFASSTRSDTQNRLRDNSGRLCADVQFNYQNVTDRLCRDFTIETECVVASCFRCEWNNQTRACTCRTIVRDFVFVVDGSGSVSGDDFALQAQVVEEIILHMISINSGVGVMQFSTTLQTEIALFPRSLTTNAVLAVQNMIQLDGNTAIGDAMAFALTNSTMLGNAQVRDESWIILITDGENNSGVDPCNASITSVLQSRPGVHVLIVGVSTGFNRAALECLVANEMNPAQHIIEMSNYSLAEFRRVAPMLDDQICR